MRGALRVPDLAAWSFQAAAQSGGTQVETSGLPDLRRQSLELWKATVAKDSRTEYQREESWRERDIRITRGSP